MRKTFLHLGLVLAVAAGASALAQVTTDTPFVVDAQFGAPSQARGGTIREAVFSVDPATCNPFVAEDTTSSGLIGGFLPSLTLRNNVTLEYVPYAALSFEVVDQFTVVYTLRRGLVWTDGTEFNSDDVILSVQLHTDPEVDSAERDTFFINDLPIVWEKFPTADDPSGTYTVVQRAPVPLADIIERASFTIVPRSVFGPLASQGAEAVRTAWTTAECTDVTFGGQLVSLGPWLMREIRPGESTAQVPNPRSFIVDANGNQLPYASVNLQIGVADANAQLAAFLAGESDLFEPTTGDQIGQIQDAIDQGRLDAVNLPNVTPGEAFDFIVFNFNRLDAKGELYRNVVFRRAMSHLTDRATAIETCIQGIGVLAFGPLPPAYPFFTDDTAKFEFNPEEANRLLDMIGLTQRDSDGFRILASGERLEIVVTPNAGNVRRECLAQLFAEDATTLGSVRTQAVPIDFNTLVSNLTVVADDGTRPFDAIIIGLSGGSTITPLGINLFPVTGSLHAWNQGRPDLNNGLPQPQVFAWELQLDDLYARHVQALDSEVRGVLVMEAQRIFAEQVPWVPVWWRGLNLARSNRLVNTQDQLADSPNPFTELRGFFIGFRNSGGIQISVP